MKRIFRITSSTTYSCILLIFNIKLTIKSNILIIFSIKYISIKSIFYMFYIITKTFFTTNNNFMTNTKSTVIDSFIFYSTTNTIYFRISHSTIRIIEYTSFPLLTLHRFIYIICISSEFRNNIIE